jgi:ABC-type transporter Mla MlaB component
MLRISVRTRADGATLTLEGRLAGPWVDELARCWMSVTDARDARSVDVQLAAVTFIDSAGKVLLRTMHEQGAALAASGCMTRAILEEIGTRSPERSGARARKDGDE